jgi:hypothetical protein
MQRVSDTWRSRIGALAITTLNSFFDSVDVAELFKTDESRQEYADKSLKTMSFLYANTKSSDREVRRIYGKPCVTNIISRIYYRNGKDYSVDPSSSKHLQLTSMLLLGQSQSRILVIRHTQVSYPTVVSP